MVKLLITGDIHLNGGRVQNLAKNGNSDKLLGDFASAFKKSDLSIINLESPIINEGEKILKTGPNLKSDVESINFLLDAGIDIVTLANNHIMDYGKAGLKSTINLCNENNIKYVGAGLTLADAKKTLFVDVSKIKIAIINITENEFGTIENQTFGSHSLNPIDNYYSIQKAALNADYVIVIVHGGHEHYSLPSPRMKSTYRFFIDAGADYVIGHHPHCISGYESYNNGRIFYSLGNFLFDKKNKKPSNDWCRGVFLELQFDKIDTDYKISPYIQNGKKVGLRILTSDELKLYSSDMASYNSIIQNDDLLNEQYNLFCQKSEKIYNGFLEPHSIRILHAMRNRSLFPSLLSKRKKRLLLNLIRCEAHRDVVKKILSE